MKSFRAVYTIIPKDDIFPDVCEALQLAQRQLKKKLSTNEWKLLQEDAKTHHTHVVVIIATSNVTYPEQKKVLELLQRQDEAAQPVGPDQEDEKSE